jgi:hypothetical protein
MQIGIAGYCVMLFFDFILRFREEVRPFMPILRVCMGKCCIFLDLELTPPSMPGTRGVPGAPAQSSEPNRDTDHTFF